jgi:hypothetical protein
METTTPQDSTGTPTRRRVSYSQYTIWSTCPHHWRLAYHDKLKPKDSSIHLIFGTAIHHAIQEWLKTLYDGKKGAASYYDLGGVFKDKLFELFKKELTTTAEDGTKTFQCGKDDLKEFYLDGLAILEHVRRYHKQYFSPKAKLIGVEVPLEVPLNDALEFVGYIDLVIQEPDGTVIIYDFKTSKAGWFYEKKDPKKVNQILLYKRFYSQRFNVDEDKIDVQFLVLKRKIPDNSEFPIKRLSKFEPANGKISVGKAVKSFQEFVDRTFAADGTVLVENLKPTPSEKACKFCPFRDKKDLCDAGPRTRNK